MIFNINRNCHRYYLIVFYFLFWYDSVQSQACSSPDISDLQFEFGYDNPDEISATFTGTIMEFQMQNTLLVDKTENSNMNKIYIDAILDSNRLQIITTPEFSNYEQEQSSNEISLIIKLICSSGSKEWIFRQKFRESNNHRPEFSQDVYDITVLLPLPKSFDLTIYQEISARDIDLRNNRVTFSSPDSTVIDVGTSSRIGEDGKTFYATLVTNQQLLTIDDKIEFTIIGTDSGNPPLQGSATIIIRGDSTSTFVPIPAFEKTLYKGLINVDRQLTIDTLRLTEITYSENVSFDISGDDRSLFKLAHDQNTVSVTLAKNLTDDDLEGKKYLTALVIAQHPETDDGSAVLLIDILTTPPPPIAPIPKFEKSIYQGQLNDDLTLSLENIVIMSDTYRDEVVYNIKGDDSPFFAINENENILSISLELISEEDLEKRDYLTFTVVASNENSGESETNVLISIPRKICPECPTTTTPEPSTCPPPVTCPEPPTTTPCPPPDPCPDCPTPEPPVIDLTPQFENKVYNFWIKSTDTGQIGEVFAEVDSPNEIEVIYSLDISDMNLQSKLDVDPTSGRILVVQEIAAGKYTFNIVATNNVDEKKSTVLGVLTVEDTLTCPLPNVSVSKSLVVQYLEENQIHTNIIGAQIEDCVYIVAGMIPNDKEYFFIDAETMSLASLSLDREADIFSDYDVPQIQVTLRLECDPVNYISFSHQTHNEAAYNNTELLRYTDPMATDGRYYVLTNDLLYNSQITMLTVIIKDVNDNYPEFTYPMDNTIIGYPEPNIAKQIMPLNLIKIKAVDRDAGLNAKIRYRLQTNDNFLIDEEQGIIYPTSQAMKNSNPIDLEVTAVDRDGADDGLSTTIHLNVVRLESDHLTVVTVNVDNSQSIDEIVDNIKETMDVKLMVLNAAFVPFDGSINSRKNSRQSEVPTSLKLVVYALDNSNRLMSTVDVQKQLELVGDTMTISSISFEESVNIIEHIIVEDNLILLIIVAILGSLLLITGIAIFCMWWYKIRPYEFKNVIDDTSSQLNLNEELKSESSPPFKTSRFEVQKRDSNILKETDKKDSNSSQLDRPLSIVIRDDNGSDNTKESRKSQTVTFNELVERIDIETGPSRESDDDIRL